MTERDLGDAGGRRRPPTFGELGHYPLMTLPSSCTFQGLIPL